MFGLDRVIFPERMTILGQDRSLGSVRRECLDYILILSQRHLHRVMREYQGYFNHARPHQGIEQRVPCQLEQRGGPPTRGKIASHPVLGGLQHRSYHW
jgi:hypothetical protein